MPERVERAGPLGTAELDRALRLLADCGAETGLTAFREATVEALARYFGYRHATFFSGATITELFTDRQPVFHGLPPGTIQRYVEEAHHSDPFARFAHRHGYRRDRVVSLDRTDPDALPGTRTYLESFLFRSGIHAKLVFFLRTPGATAGIGLLAREPGRFGAKDVALAQLLSRQLENLFRLYHEQAEPQPRPGLSPRQVAVAELVARGLTNQEIADSLFITVATVKKHLTRVLEATGCANRTQLALRWQRPGQSIR